MSTRRTHHRTAIAVMAMALFMTGMTAASRGDVRAEAQLEPVGDFFSYMYQKFIGPETNASSSMPMGSPGTYAAASTFPTSAPMTTSTSPLYQMAPDSMTVPTTGMPDYKGISSSYEWSSSTYTSSTTLSVSSPKFDISSSAALSVSSVSLSSVKSSNLSVSSVSLSSPSSSVLSVSSVSLSSPSSSVKSSTSISLSSISVSSSSTSSKKIKPCSSSSSSSAGLIHGCTPDGVDLGDLTPVDCATKTGGCVGKKAQLCDKVMKIGPVNIDGDEDNDCLQKFLCKKTSKSTECDLSNGSGKMEAYAKGSLPEEDKNLPACIFMNLGGGSNVFH